MDQTEHSEKTIAIAEMNEAVAKFNNDLSEITAKHGCGFNFRWEYRGKDKLLKVMDTAPIIDLTEKDLDLVKETESILSKLT